MDLTWYISSILRRPFLKFYFIFNFLALKTFGFRYFFLLNNQNEFSGNCLGVSLCLSSKSLRESPFGPDGVMYSPLVYLAVAGMKGL